MNFTCALLITALALFPQYATAKTLKRDIQGFRPGMTKTEWIEHARSLGCRAEHFTECSNNTGNFKANISFDTGKATWVMDSFKYDGSPKEALSLVCKQFVTDCDRAKLGEPIPLGEGDFLTITQTPGNYYQVMIENPDLGRPVPKAMTVPKF